MSDEIGYVMNDREVQGVYSHELAAVVGDGGVYIGRKESDNEIRNAVKISADSMNEFCLMWLLIFDPDVIKGEL